MMSLAARRTAVRVAIGAAIIGLLASTWYAWSGPIAESADSVRELAAWIRSWGMSAVLAAISLMVAHSFVPFPAELAAIANCVVFGPYAGFAVTWVGAMLGACIAFGLARHLGRPFVMSLSRGRYGGRIDRFDRWMERRGSLALLLCRLVPLISFNVINFGAGLSAVSWWTFIWTTGVGIVPVTALMMVLAEKLI